MVHLAMQEADDHGIDVVWLAHVMDQQYSAPSSETLVWRKAVHADFRGGSHVDFAVGNGGHGELYGLTRLIAAAGAVPQFGGEIGSIEGVQNRCATADPLYGPHNSVGRTE